MTQTAAVPAASGYTQQQLEQMDTDALLRLYKETGDQALKWPLVLRYEGLIRSTAMRVRSVYAGFTQIDDIVNEGIITLLSAVDKFEPERGVKFETYVAKRIRGMIFDLARKQDWTPRNVRQRASEIDRTTQELTASLGRYPTEEEMVQRLGTTKERYQKDVAGIALSNVLSLDMLLDVQEAEDYRVEVPSMDTAAQPEQALEEQELHQVLGRAISRLKHNEQTVLSLYYEKNLSMKEIAQVMQLSGPRISQIHTRALQKLRWRMGQYLHGLRTKQEEGGR